MTANPKNDKERTESTLQLLNEGRIKLLGEKLNKGYFESDDFSRLSKYTSYAKSGLADFDDVKTNELKKKLDKDVAMLTDLLSSNSKSASNGRYDLLDKKDIKNAFNNLQKSSSLFLKSLQGKSQISSNPTEGISQQAEPPKCYEKQGIGYIKFKDEEEIKIGEVANQPYKLCKYLTDRFGGYVNIELVFDAMMAGKIKRESLSLDRGKKYKKIQNTFKELQKGGKIHRLNIFPDDKQVARQVKLDYR